MKNINRPWYSRANQRVGALPLTRLPESRVHWDGAEIRARLPPTVMLVRRLEEALLAYDALLDEYVALKLEMAT